MPTTKSSLLSVDNSFQWLLMLILKEAEKTRLLCIPCIARITIWGRFQCSQLSTVSHV